MPRKSSVKRPRKPAGKPEPKKPEQHSEKCLQYHCQQWLEETGIWNRLLIFHVPNERKGGIGAIMHFKKMGVLDGVADYLAFTLRRRVAAELKKEGKEARKGQEKFRKRWEAAGGEYHLFDTLESFQAFMSALDMFG